MPMPEIRAVDALTTRPPDEAGKLRTGDTGSGHEQPAVRTILSESYAWLQAFAGAPALATYVHRLVFGDVSPGNVVLLLPQPVVTPPTATESYPALIAYSGGPLTATQVHRIAFGDT